MNKRKTAGASELGQANTLGDREELPDTRGAEAIVQQLPLGELHPSPMQVRRRAEESEALRELARSIEQVGILEPLVVRRCGATGWEIVMGHRRAAAARIAGLTHAPCLVRGYADAEVLELILIENVQRADLHPLDEAAGFAALRKSGMEIATIASKIGRSPAYVAQRLRLVELAPKVRKALEEEGISLGVAVELAKLPDGKAQEQALAAVEMGGGALMTVSEARLEIAAKVMRRLAEAAFDAGDETLPGGACASCPKRTGAQGLLFASAQADDLCTDPKCFEKKIDVHWSRLAAAAKAKKQQVLTQKESEQLAYYGAPWVRVTSSEYVGEGKSVRVGKLVPDVPRALARDPATGQAVEVVPRAAVQKALKAAKKVTPNKVDEQLKAAAKARKNDLAARKAVLSAVGKRLVSKVIDDATRGDIARRVFKDVLPVVTSAMPYCGFEESGKELVREAEWAVLYALRVVMDLQHTVDGHGDRKVLYDVARILGLDPKGIAKEAIAAEAKGKATKPPKGHG